MAKSKKAKFTETTYLESAPTVDAAAGILRGVKLLGSVSRNGRRYTEKAMKEAVGLYDGRKIYLNHPNRNAVGEDRPFQDWVGESRNPIIKPDGIYGDVQLRQKSEYFEGIIEAAEKFPKSVGFSHVADGKSRMEGGEEIIESITEVFSVDLVTDPATTSGFFESTQPKTVRAALESLPDGITRKRLLEMVDLGTIDGSMSMGAEEPSEPDDPLSMAQTTINTLITMLGETLKALAMKKDTPATPPAAPTEPAEEPNKNANTAPAPNANDGPPDFAAMQRENAELKAKNLLLESGRESKPAWVKALAAVTDEAGQKELLESLPVEESASATRPARSPALLEASAIVATDIDTPEKFAARYR